MPDLNITVDEAALARLDLAPGDALLLRIPEPVSVEETAYIQAGVGQWLAEHGFGNPVLVLPASFDVSKLVGFGPAVEPVGDVKGGGWPHERQETRPGIVDDRKRASGPEQRPS